MYYPYLRARQFELIALRELASENFIQNLITPIFEPVKDTFNNLNLASKIFREKDLTAYLIVNPSVGERSGDIDDYLNYLITDEGKNLKPAFHYNRNSEYIREAVQQYDLNECMLICYCNFSEDDQFRALCEENFVSHIVLFEPHKYRSLDRYLKGLEKNYVTMNDSFERQIKNADFLDIPAHKFTEEHLFYKGEGYQGFCDFTVLPSEYVEGGSTPRAVAIHLTYVNEQAENQIWIRHFTSITNDSIANVQGKFAEAAQKAINFSEKQNLNNSAITELKDYYVNGKYPGLGTVKKISIKNHLSIVSDYLFIHG